MATSKLQARVGELLHQYLPKMTIRENYRPDWLITEDGNRLELDFFIEDLGIAIEVQGEQHFSFVPFFHVNYEGFQKRLTFDQFKRDTCYKNGISLIEIADTMDADTIIPVLRPQSDLYMTSEVAASVLRKQMVAIAIAWTEIKNGRHYAQVREAAHKSKSLKLKVQKETDPAKRKELARKQNNAAKSFHTKNDNLYREFVDRFVQLMSE